jgi:hypothetical protein
MSSGYVYAWNEREEVYHEGGHGALINAPDFVVYPRRPYVSPSEDQQPQAPRYQDIKHDK